MLLAAAGLKLAPEIVTIVPGDPDNGMKELIDGTWEKDDKVKNDKPGRRTYLPIFMVSVWL